MLGIGLFEVLFLHKDTGCSGTDYMHPCIVWTVVVCLPGWRVWDVWWGGRTQFLTQNTWCTLTPITNSSGMSVCNRQNMITRIVDQIELGQNGLILFCLLCNRYCILRLVLLEMLCIVLWIAFYIVSVLTGTTLLSLGESTAIRER